MAGRTSGGDGYGTQTVTAPNGQPVTVFPLLNSPIARRFLRTNGDGFFSRYHGIMFGVSRRLANRWTANVNYTYSVSHEPGRQCRAPPRRPGRRSERSASIRQGRDTNLDRPHIFKHERIVRGLPKIEVQVSGNLARTSGRPVRRAVPGQVAAGPAERLLRGAGSLLRKKVNQWLHLRVQKILFRRGPHRLEVGAEIRNLLQETSIDNLITSVFSSPNFGKPAQWATPRQLMFRVRGYW